VANALWSYYELLWRWNQKINLTALEQPDEAIDRLLLEPLAAARYLPKGAKGLIDVGSGGGSPAIPLKLAAPHLRLIMVESKVRKAAFLREAVRHLNLENTVVEAARFEELLTRPDLHEALDIVTIRAVRVETRILLSLQAFLAPGGQILLFRGRAGLEPQNLLPPLHWLATYPLIDSIQSRLVVVEKQPVGQRST
jgi:16S rRNA (guanine527-N7)-methyltransferase